MSLSCQSLSLSKQCNVLIHRVPVSLTVSKSFFYTFIWFSTRLIVPFQKIGADEADGREKGINKGNP